MLFITVSPDNITDKMRIRLSTTPDAFEVECQATRHERESLQYAFPGAEALSFHHLVQRFLFSAVGWDGTCVATVPRCQRRAHRALTVASAVQWQQADRVQKAAFSGMHAPSSGCALWVLPRCARRTPSALTTVRAR